MIAYELPLGLGILGVVLATGSLRLDDVIGRQAETGIWFLVAQPLGFIAVDCCSLHLLVIKFPTSANYSNHSGKTYASA